MSMQDIPNETYQRQLVEELRQKVAEQEAEVKRLQEAIGKALCCIPEYRHEIGEVVISEGCIPTIKRLLKSALDDGA